MSSSVPPPRHPFDSRPALRNVLTRLHTLSLSQESERANRGTHFPSNITTTSSDGFEDQLVALDEDKCIAMYTILRSIGATRVVEAGTSYGVSLIYLLAAVNDNIRDLSARPSPHSAMVIGTEKEASKIKKALAHVSEAFGEIPKNLKVLEGDLLQTLEAENFANESIDALLLDIWAPLSLPTLKILLPFRKGAAVFIDNSVASAERYKDLLSFIRAEGSGFKTTNLPFSCGFEFCVYNGNEK